MACLESAIFSIDLDDDHIDDVMYQEGGDTGKKKKQQNKRDNNYRIQDRIQKLLQKKSRNGKLSKEEEEKLEQLKISLDAEIKSLAEKMQGRQSQLHVLKQQKKLEKHKNQISELLRSKSAPASVLNPESEEKIASEIERSREAAEQSRTRKKTLENERAQLRKETSSSGIKSLELKLLQKTTNHLKRPKPKSIDTPLMPSNKLTVKRCRRKSN